MLLGAADLSPRNRACIRDAALGRREYHYFGIELERRVARAIGFSMRAAEIAAVGVPPGNAHASATVADVPVAASRAIVPSTPGHRATAEGLAHHVMTPR